MTEKNQIITHEKSTIFIALTKPLVFKPFPTSKPQNQE